MAAELRKLVAQFREFAAMHRQNVGTENRSDILTIRDNANKSLGRADGFEKAAQYLENMLNEE